MIFAYTENDKVFLAKTTDTYKTGDRVLTKNNGTYKIDVYNKEVKNIIGKIVAVK
ncbi:MAG: hypothetical protein ACOCRO_10415 [Halanaerobiales bacterium]